MTGKSYSAFALMVAMTASGLSCDRRESDEAIADEPVSPAVLASAEQPSPDPAKPARQKSASKKTALKPGLWRVEGPEFDALAEQGKVYLCIDAATTALIDPPPPKQAECSLDEGKPKPDLYLGTVECRYPDRTIVSRVRIDSDNLYFRDVTIQRGTAPVTSSAKTSRFAEWSAPCRPNQDAGRAYTQAYDDDAMYAAQLPAVLIPATSGN